MTTQQVADRFYELAQQGQYSQIQQELYAEHAKSVEPGHQHEMPSVEGLAAIFEKDRQFNASVEAIHGGYCTKPLVAGNFFTCTIGMDVTFKGMERMNMEEVAVYEVRDGKIVLEQFFY